MNRIEHSPTENDMEIILTKLAEINNLITLIEQEDPALFNELKPLLDDPLELGKAFQISECRLLYEEFGNNPLHAWHAIDIWKTSGFKEQPLWAFSVAFSISKKLIELDASSSSVIGTALKQAMKLDGHKLGQFKDNLYWLNVFHEIHNIIPSVSNKKEAFRLISEKHRGKAGSPENVEKRYYDFKAHLIDKPIPKAFGP